MRSTNVGDARDLMDRIYLFVAPEEYLEVQASGACWDDASKSWYIGEGVEPAGFTRWLGQEEGEAPFGIVCEEAFVAYAPSLCVSCGNEIEVVCIYGKRGLDTEIGNPIADFTVFNIWAMDEGLAKQLKPWPSYRPGVGEDAESRLFANHCAHCGAMQEDYRLHSEPGDVFFGLAIGAPGVVEFTAVQGRACFSGDYGFGL